MNKKKITLLILGALFLLIVSIIVTYLLIDKEGEQEEIQAIEKIDEMEEFDYYLEKDATKYYKTLYKELKDILKNKEINEEEYAKKIAQLFVADFFNLDNKITSSDIGGLQFVYSDFKEDFINIAKTSLYSNVESNIYGDRKQILPIVNKVDILNIVKSSFIYQDKEHDSYNIKLNIEYEKDLDYPKEYNLVLIYNDKYLQVASSN